MGVRWLQCRVALIALLATLVLSIGMVDARAQGADDLASLRDQVSQLYSQGKYAEAVPIAERYVALARRKHGEEHTEFATATFWLAYVYAAQGRYAEAESFYTRSLAIREKALGPEHPDVAAALNNLGHLYDNQNRYAEAEPLLKRSLAIREKALGPEHPDVGQSLNNLAELYHSEGRYTETEPLYKRSLAIREKALGPDHPDVGESLNNLAVLYENQGRTAEAESLYKRSIAIREKALGPEHPGIATALNNLGLLYKDQGRATEAEPLLNRALALREKALGPKHLDVASTLNNLGFVYWALGRTAETERLFKRSLTIREEALGPEHPRVATDLNNLGFLYNAQGRYGEVEPLYKRSLAIREKALGPEHPDVATSLNNLAGLYGTQGRYAEAEAFYKRALGIREKALGPKHPDVAAALNNLGELYESEGRYAEAEPLYKRALGIWEMALGPEHSYVATALNNLAGVYDNQGRYAEAEPLYKRSLAIGENATVLNNLGHLYDNQGRYAEAEPFYKRALGIWEKALGAEHPNVAAALNNLASVYDSQGRYAEAEPLLKRALAIREKALGPEHRDVAKTLNSLGVLHDNQGRYVEAEPFYTRSLAICEKVLGPEHPDVAVLLNNLAALSMVQGDWTRAAAFWRRSTGIVARRTQRGGDGETLTGKQKGEAQRNNDEFFGLVKMVHRLASKERDGAEGEAREMFETAQWALASEAAASLAQMAARGAKGDPTLAILVRERQDLVAEWQKGDSLRTAAVSQPPDKRNKDAEAANTARLEAIDKRITEIDTTFKDKFPDYAALGSPTPLSVIDAQALLGPDEALILFLDTPQRKPTPEETFIWVVTKNDMRWAKSEFGTKALTERVAALRCGLDDALWNDVDSADKCVAMLKKYRYDANIGGQFVQVLPFDLERAHALYNSLFGQVEDLIRDKHLLLVPSGALTQLPFQVLLTAPSAAGEYRAASWLARKHAITVLPAVSSLKALRRVGRPSAATKPMIGFGNPLLDGDQGDRKWGVYYKQQAALARQKQTCPVELWQRIAGLSHLRRSVAPMATRDGRPDLDQLRVQAALPDTADELCAVAKDLRLSPDDILLGARATETTIKRLSTEGRLANYRVVHFATHGAVSGEVSGTNEPGLILSPPKKQTDEDDGYLSASEVAALKFDADWVILSACNTAAGGAQGAEALSGLARAFIYAGARALLVSHWAVSSEATASLITNAVGAISRDKKLGRAEALRRAMLAMIDKGKPHEAHPAYWAPFVVVGEGGAQEQVRSPR